MGISLGQAGRQLKISKGTLSKAIGSGKLSATRNTDGSWAIDAAELQRYWNEHGHRFNRSETVESDQSETTPKPDAATDILIAELRGALSDLRQDRDHWRNMCERLSLTAQKLPENPPATPKPTPVKRRRVLGWVWRRAG